MTSLVAALLVVGMVLYLWREAKPFVDRKLKVQEKATLLQELAIERPIEKRHDPMPPDLVAYVTRDPAEWARRDAEKRVEELYQQTKDWTHVWNIITQEEFQRTEDARGLLESYEYDPMDTIINGPMRAKRRDVS